MRLLDVFFLESGIDGPRLRGDPIDALAFSPYGAHSAGPAFGVDGARITRRPGRALGITVLLLMSGERRSADSDDFALVADRDLRRALPDPNVLDLVHVGFLRTIDIGALGSGTLSVVTR